MKTTKYQAKILDLIDLLMNTLKHTPPPFELIKEQVHTLFEYASLDTVPITVEKQSSLKALIEELHNIEHNQDKDLTNLIKALSEIKSMYL